MMNYIPDSRPIFRALTKIALGGRSLPADFIDEVPVAKDSV